MRWVEHPTVRPHHCAVLPYMGASNATRGFIDTGTDLPGFDNHVYISVDAVEEMARLCGWGSPQTVQALMDQIARLENELVAVVEDRDRLADKQAAFDLITSEGWRVRNKPGRPKKNTEEEVAA